MTTPCKECPNRHVSCHTDCEQYREFAEQKRQANKRPYDLASAFLLDGIAKSNHRRHRKVKR